MAARMGPRAFGREIVANANSINNNVADSWKATRPRHATFQSLDSSAALTKQSVPIIPIVAADVRTPDVATRDLRNVLVCDGYLEDIFKSTAAHARKQLPDALPPLDSLSGHIRATDRRSLVEWVIEIHLKLSLCDECLFLAVHLFDRSLKSMQAVARRDLQLIAVTALSMAAKIEETRPPLVSVFADWTTHAVSETAIKDCERKMLAALDFNLVHASSLQLLQMLAKFGGLSVDSEEQLDAKSREREEKTRMLVAQYGLELTLSDAAFIEHDSVMRASAAYYLMRRLYKIRPPWPPHFAQLTGLYEDQVKRVAKQIYACVPTQARPPADTTYVRKKFDKLRYLEVAQLLVDNGIEHRDREGKEPNPKK